MLEVIDIFEEIKNTSSTNEKKEIIKRNKDNELFKKCLVFLLNDQIITGISEKKINKEINEYDTYCPELNTFEEVMKYLKENSTGRDADVLAVQKFIAKQPVVYRQFYTELVTKKYRLGCDAKVVNSVIKGLIYEWSVMLGTPIEKAKLNGDERIFISRKLNGVRCTVVGGRCISRQGKEFTGLQHIIGDIRHIDLFNDMAIDGELLYKNEENLNDSSAFQFGTGLANSKAEDKSCLKLVIFDIIPEKEFFNGQSPATYATRLAMIEKIEKAINALKLTNIEVVERLYNGYDHSKIWECLEYAEQHDWEGCIVNLDKPYECKRTKTLLKVKKFFDSTLRIVDVEEGTGRNKGRLGAFVVKYYDNTINVGSGFSDEQREEIWVNKDSYIGKLIDVKYKEVTENKNGTKSLQFPVYLGLRYDKENADDEV